MKNRENPNVLDILPRLLTVGETLELLSISRSLLYKVVAEGRLRPVKIGKSTRFTRDEIARFISELSSD
jgi:excisionase family DNA binding protein